jgi:hypothetical protein
VYYSNGDKYYYREYIHGKKYKIVLWVLRYIYINTFFYKNR